MREIQHSMGGGSSGKILPEIMSEMQIEVPVVSLEKRSGVKKSQGGGLE